MRTVHCAMRREQFAPHYLTHGPLLDKRLARPPFAAVAESEQHQRHGEQGRESLSQ